MQQDHITPRQREIWRLVAKALSVKEIADRLDIAPSTVANHKKALYRALGVCTQAQAVIAWGERQGSAGE